ncbi:MAG: type II secretion system protein [Planctomycetes bacterium]|nr:type II secretion system protein [Planctomycetota bacterium]
MTMKKRAFTLAEVTVVIIFIAVLALVAIPRMNFSLIKKQKADYQARKIVTDLHRTRLLAISDAATNTDGFALSMTGAAPYTGYEIVNLNTAEIVDSHSITPGINCTGGSDFNFGPLGNLKPGSDTQVVVSAETKTFTIDVTSATGMVKCTEN